MRSFDLYCLFRYYRVNCDCEKKKDLVIKKLESEKDDIEYCECGAEVKFAGQIANFLGKFSMRTASDRREILAARSKEHYTKKIADKKVELIRQVDREGTLKLDKTGKMHGV